jgi:excisionase family DNA binding protein
VGDANAAVTTTRNSAFFSVAKSASTKNRIHLSVAKSRGFLNDVRNTASAFAGTYPALRGDSMGSRLAYSVTESCVAAGIGRTNLYELITRGEIRAKKVGRRTLILADDLRQWLEALPQIAPRKMPDVTRPTQAALPASSSANCKTGKEL